MPQSISVVPLSKWDSTKPKDLDTKRYDLSIGALENAYRGIDKDPSIDRLNSFANAAAAVRKEGAALVKSMDKKKHGKVIDWIDGTSTALAKAIREAEARVNELSTAKSSVNLKALEKPALSSDWVDSCGFEASAAKALLAQLRVFENAERGVAATKNLAEWGPKANKALQEVKTAATKLANDVKRSGGDSGKAQADALTKLAQLASKKAEDFPA